MLESIRSLIYWLPIIWKDRHWDHSFIFILLRHKLVGVEKCLREGNTIGCEKNANRVKLCVLLLDRLIADNYHENALRFHYQKWGKPYFSVWRLIILSPKALTRKEVKQERIEHIQCAKHREFLRQQDIDYLFKTMTKYIQHWWD